MTIGESQLIFNKVYEVISQLAKFLCGVTYLLIVILRLWYNWFCGVGIDDYDIASFAAGITAAWIITARAGVWVFCSSRAFAIGNATTTFFAFVCAVSIDNYKVVI